MTGDRSEYGEGREWTKNYYALLFHTLARIAGIFSTELSKELYWWASDTCVYVKDFSGAAYMAKRAEQDIIQPISVRKVNIFTCGRIFPIYLASHKGDNICAACFSFSLLVSVWVSSLLSIISEGGETVGVGWFLFVPSVVVVLLSGWVVLGELCEFLVAK